MADGLSRWRFYSPCIMSADETNETTAPTSDDEVIDETTNWPDLGIALYERLTGRGATITYTFEDMEVAVPSKVGPDADHAHWHVNGTLRISTSEDD